MPNKDPDNRNLSISIPETLKKRMLDFIDRENKKDSLTLSRMTIRLLVVKAGYEFIGGNDDSRKS